MDSATSTDQASVIPPSALLVAELASLGLAVLVVASRNATPRWLIADIDGSVIEESQSHLLALAKLQIEALNRFGRSLASPDFGFDFGFDLSASTRAIAAVQRQMLS